MSTKVASYLTDLGFRQLSVPADGADYNIETGGQYVILKSNNRIYRYDADAPDCTVDDENYLDTSDGGNSRWISVGGASQFLTRVEYVFNEYSNVIPLPHAVTDKKDIIYVNINNTQVLSTEYQLGEDMQSVEVSQYFMDGVKAELIVVMGDLSAVIEGGADTSLINTGRMPGCILEAPNGVCRAEGSLIFVEEGLRILIPNGKDFYGRTQSTSLYCTAEESTQLSSLWREVEVFYGETGLDWVPVGHIFDQQNTPLEMIDGITYRWYNPDTHFWKEYNSLANDGEWVVINSVPIAEVTVERDSDTAELVTIRNPLVIADRNDTVNKNLTNISMTETDRFLTNGVHSIQVDDAITFVLPTPIENCFNQIKVFMYLTDLVEINWGTTTFFGGEEPTISMTGMYHVYWDYNPLSGKWVCGILLEA